MASRRLAPPITLGPAAVNTTTDAPALRNARTPAPRTADRHRTQTDRHSPGYMRAYMAAWRARRRAEQGAA
jgi:hypothetical protein